MVTKRKIHKEIRVVRLDDLLLRCVAARLCEQMSNHQVLKHTTVDANVEDHAKQFANISSEHYISGKYSLCTFLKRGVEDWANKKKDAGIITGEQLTDFIGGLVYDSEVYEKNSNRHPWHPGHDLGSTLWNYVNDINSIISERSHLSLLLLNILRTRKGFEAYRKLNEINFFPI